MIASWLPQNDLLADRRVKLFITHSGNNGQFESLYHAVPMIGFPIHGDQSYNAHRLEAKGYGIVMDVHDFTAQKLGEHMRRILTDDSYAKRIRKASDIFRSAKETPAERAAYWIEHVTRFGGDHLRSAGSYLNFFEYFMIDVIAAIPLVIAGLLFLALKLCKCVLRQVVFLKTQALDSEKKYN